MRSREVLLGLAVVGLLSYAACTAEKSAMKNPETVVAGVVKSEVVPDSSVKGTPKWVDGVFTTQEHLQPVYFDLNKSKLSEKEMETIKANAEWLKDQPPFLVKIVGFADSRGSAKKNERLAQRRALAVKESYAALEIDPERISIAGRGAEDPACVPVTETCLALGRRAETLIEDKSLASR